VVVKSEECLVEAAQNGDYEDQRVESASLSCFWNQAQKRCRVIPLGGVSFAAQ